MADSVSQMLKESEVVQASAAKLIAETDNLVERARKKVEEFGVIQAEKARNAEAFRDLVNIKGLPPGSSVKALAIAFDFIGGVARAEGIATEGLREAGIPEPGLKADGAPRRPRTGRVSV